LRVIGRKNSSTRFAVWFSALLAIGVAPLMGSLSFGSAGTGRPLLTVSSTWGEWLLGLWGLIAAVALLRVAIGLWGLRGLRRRQRAIDLESLDPSVRQTVGEFHLSRKVTLAISNELRVPTAIGFFRPMIILPKWALTELPADELSAILIHELAHLKRWDDCTNLAQKILRAIFFFNPAICWIENRLSLEREMACDDVVLTRTDNPVVYARSLVAVAERSFMRRGIALAQAAVSRMRQTSHRVAQILDGEHPGAIHVWKPVFAMVTILSATSIIALTHTPQLISFHQVPEHVAPIVAADVSPAPQGMMIPASFHPSTSQPVLPQRAQSTPKLTARRPARRQFIPRKPAVVLASAPGQITTQTLFVVWQERDNNETPFWTLCIWRVTFVNSGRVAPRVPARST
jgi:beta-lactamase regulating signal transducer with metallopeptidase domain